MKNILIASALLMVFGVAQAQTTTSIGSANTGGTAAGQQSVSTNTNTVGSESNSAATNAGNSQAITFTSPEKTTSNVNQTVSGSTSQTQIVQGGTNSTLHQTFGTQTIKNTPSVSASPLTSSNDTCMGSASGSANVPGIGLSFGKTYTDDNCVMLKNSRELWNMGMKAASMALMCMDKNNKAALEMTGFVCPQTEQAQRAAKANEPTDPIVRRRLGLPELASN